MSFEWQRPFVRQQQRSDPPLDRQQQQQRQRRAGRQQRQRQQLRLRVRHRRRQTRRRRRRLCLQVRPRNRMFIQSNLLRLLKMTQKDFALNFTLSLTFSYFFY